MVNNMYSRGPGEGDPEERVRRAIGDADDGGVVDLHFGVVVGMSFCK